MGIRSCNYSSNRTHFLPIRQTFVLFTRVGRKGLRCPCWEIVHVRWSSILGKWDGSILKRYFGGYFTKRPVFCARKMEKGFSVRQKGKLPPATLLSIPMSTHMRSQYGHNITNYAAILAITLAIWTESHETSNMIGHFVKVFSKHDQYTESGIFTFNYVTKYDTTRRIFIVRIFFEFIMPVLNYLNF